MLKINLCLKLVLLISVLFINSINLTKLRAATVDSQTTNWLECTDSDGRDYFNKGYVVGKYIPSDSSTGIVHLITYNDRTYRTTNVVEYYCQDNQVKAEIIACRNGSNDGACNIDIVISVRFDDISFGINQKPILEKALELARKHRIKIDLGVIARRFQNDGVQDTYQLFENNQDVFEIVAHGYTHRHPDDVPPPAPITMRGEFYDITNRRPMTYEFQADHILQMKNIFQARDLEAATKIFLVPWSAGDLNTIQIAKDYGYKVLSQSFTPTKSNEYNADGMLISKVMVGGIFKQQLTDEDIENFKQNIYRLIEQGETRIQLLTHDINYIETEYLDKLLDEVVNDNLYRERIKYDFLSNAYKEFIYP